MQCDDKYTPTEAGGGDHVHALARAGIGSIPIAGAAATELFQKLITPPLENRRQKWMDSIAEGLRQLEKQQRLSLDDLAVNDIFIDTVMSASQAAIRTSQEEKLEALINAVLNSSLPEPPDESRQQIFIGLVDSLTVWHLRILRFFFDPASVFREQGKPAPQYVLAGSLSQLLTKAYPELTNERELYDQIGKDLYGKGLLGTEGLHTMMTGHGVYEKRTTTLGDQFLRFISKPMQ